MNIHRLLTENKNIRIMHALSGQAHHLSATNNAFPPGSMQIAALSAYVEMMKLKNYSPNSIKTSRNHFVHFLQYFIIKSHL